MKMAYGFIVILYYYCLLVVLPSWSNL